MALTIEQFIKLQHKDRNKLARGMTPVGVDKCADCRIPLQESITGNRPIKRGKRLIHVCSDCYYKELGAELDKHPIFMPRSRRG